jgi:hypothetical protein
MKNLILVFSFVLVSFFGICQPTMDGHILNHNCNYQFVASWSGQNYTNMQFNDISQSGYFDGTNFGDYYTLYVPDSLDSFTFQICAIPDSSCGCQPACFGPIQYVGGMYFAIEICKTNNLDENILDTKKVVMITDITGRPIEVVKNKIMYYYYSDESVKSVFISE